MLNASLASKARETGFSQQRQWPSPVMRLSVPRSARGTGRPLAAAVARTLPGHSLSHHRRKPTARLVRSRRCRLQSVAEEAALDQAEAGVEAAESFSWTEAWYPVGTVENLHEDAPNTFKLLDKGMVAWMAKDGTWSAAVEECPHKLASLGLGKVDPETGDIVCRYHGWCFNGSGQCTSNPQAPNEAVAKTACSSAKSKLETFPAVSKHGLLWVWPSSSSPPRGEPSIDFDRTPSSWTQVTQSVGYTFMVENSMDPSHANWLHEGLAAGPEAYGPESALPMEDFTLAGEMTARGGFSLHHGGYKRSQKGMKAQRTFVPPSTQITQYQMPSGVTSTFLILFVPAGPGKTNVFLSFVFDSPGGGKGPMPPSTPKHIAILKFVQGLLREPLKTVLLSMAPAYVATGLGHVGGAGSRLGLQDLKAMHTIEVAMSSRKAQWAKEYHLPTPSDVGTITFRRWLDKFGGGGPTWLGTSPTSVVQKTDSELLDRWEVHTKGCKACRKTITWLEEVQGRLQRSKGMLQMAASLLALVAAAVALLSVKSAVCVGSVAVLVLSVSGLVASAASGVGDMLRGFFTGVSSAGNPMVDLYPHEKTGDKSSA